MQQPPVATPPGDLARGDHRGRRLRGRTAGAGRRRTQVPNQHRIASILVTGFANIGWVGVRSYVLRDMQ